MMKLCYVKSAYLGIYHRICLQITSTEYNELQNSGDKWQCTKCTNKDNSSQSNICQSSPVYLPDFVISSSSLDKASWGELKGTEISQTVNNVYYRVVKWKKNLFKIRTGKVGQEFIEEVSKTLSLYISGSHFESIALTMAMIIFPLLLQKPSRSSKSKDHILYLERRLTSWKAGELDKLLKECTTIQNRLSKAKVIPGHHEKVFTRLMLYIYNLGKYLLLYDGMEASAVHC